MATSDLKLAMQTSTYDTPRGVGGKINRNASKQDQALQVIANQNPEAADKAMNALGYSSSTTPPAQTSLTSQSLTPTQSFNITPPQQSTAADGFSGYLGALSTQVAQQKAQAAQSKDEYQINLLKADTETGLLAKAYANTVDPAEAELSDINNQIVASQHAQMRELEAIGKNGALTPAQASAQQAAINRKYTFEQADLSVIQMAKQGKFDSAKAIADRAVNALLEKQKMQLDALKFNYEDNRDLFTKSEQRLFETAQGERERTLQNEEYRLRAEFDQKIKQSDPMYQAALREQQNKAITSAPGYGSAGEGVDAPLYNGLKPATATAVRSQVGAFKAEPVVQNFAVVQEGRNFAGSLSDTTTNPSDDQALIYAFAKAMDPGSVVREGEYATVQKYSQSLVDSYGAGINQALNGTGFLTQTTRRKLKDTIEARYKSSLGSYTALTNNYSQGINALTGRDDGEKFIRDYRIGGGQQAPAQADLPALASQKSIPTNELQDAIQQYGEEAVRQFLEQ